MAWTRVTVLLIAATLLFQTGCSNVWRAQWQAFEYMLATPVDKSVTSDEMAKSQKPLAYVRRDHKGQLILESAGELDGADYWRATDSGMLVYHGGRLIKALGFQLSLVHVEAKGLVALTPVTIGTKVGFKQTLVMDWSAPERQQQFVQSEITGKQPEMLQVQDLAIRTIRIDETVHFEDDTIFINQYWFAASSGEIVRTIQKPASQWHQLDLTYISRIYALHAGGQG